MDRRGAPRGQRWCAGKWPGCRGGGRPVQREGGGNFMGHDHPGQGRPGGSPEEIASVVCASGGKKRVWRLDIAALVRHDRAMDRRTLERLGHHVVSRRVALGYRTAPIWPTACSSPCAPWPTSSTACARPARAPTPCWKTSWPGHPAASTPSWRAGNPKSPWPNCAGPAPCPALPRRPRRPVPCVHRGVAARAAAPHHRLAVRGPHIAKSQTA